MDVPAPDALERAKVGIAAEASRTRKLAVEFGVVAAVGILLAVVLPHTVVALGAIMAIAGGILGLLFSWAGLRVNAARRSLVGPYRSVWAVGWSRPPDGCNYALFEGAADARDRPDWVLRLPVVREVQSGSAFLCGELQPGNMFGGNALIGVDGDFLAAGRIVSPDLAQKRWERRNKPKSRWVSGGPGQRAAE